MSASRKAKAEAQATEEEATVPPPLSLAEALGISLNINQGWTPILSPDGAVIGATGEDGTKVHVKVAHPGTLLLEFVK